MTEHPEHPERAEVENRDPATTAVLERIIVPDHAPDFWDELALDMGDDDATVIVDRRFARWSTPRSTQRLLLAAAVVLVLLVGTAVLTTLPGTGGDQSIDAGPTADGDGDSGPDGVPPPSRSQIGGDDAQWFFSDRMAWTGDEFVTGFELDVRLRATTVTGRHRTASTGSARTDRLRPSSTRSSARPATAARSARR